MGTAQSKQVSREPHATKTDPRLCREEEIETESDQGPKMPSIEQCEAASGSVAALASTLEIFDKFKSVSDNGKDSDSEESFHLPLDDDDMESQSVVSNGRDKEIHNEETEDDILNKFETVASGTPDHIDPHIEDSILDDVEHSNDKDVDIIASKGKASINIGLKLFKDHKVDESQEFSDNIKTRVEIPSQVEKSSSQDKEANKTKVEVKLTYDFEEYENSGDGEFKSIYETDDLAAELTDEEPEPESTETAEITEPMEITEEPDSTPKVEEPAPPQKRLRKVEEGLDTFEDSMEVEQEDTNQDIANIIEKLEGQDTPMEEAEPLTLNDEADVNMTESCEEAALTSEKIEDAAVIDENIPNRDEEGIEESNDDVEMIADSQTNEGSRENSKENVDQAGNDKSPVVAATFPDPLEESKDSTETCSGEAQEQTPVNQEKSCSDNEVQSSGDEKKPEAQATSTETVKVLDNEVESSGNEKKLETQATSAKTVKVLDNQAESVGNDEKSHDPVESKNNLLKDEDSSESLQEEPLKSIVAGAECGINMETSELSSDKPLKSAETDSVDLLKPENIDEGKCSGSDDAQNDNLLKTLDETISGSDKEEQEVTENDKNIENKETETLKQSEIDETPENVPSKDEEVFKVPEEVPKIADEVPSQREEKEGPDIESEKSNDKTDEDESDLLDISMVRETEEDDACAIADALDDKEAQISERSDEEQSEKVETEQESSDVDKDNEDNENEPIGFDDSDDESHMDGVEQDDSSNAESAKGKIINISESSKDSVSDSELKQRKVAIGSSTDISNDVTAIEVSASESEEPEKMDVPESLVPDTSLSLDTTTAQDDAVPCDTDVSIPLAASEIGAENKEVTVQDKDEASSISKTDKISEKAKVSSETMEVGQGPAVDSLSEGSKSTEDISEKRKSSLNKRTLSASDIEDSDISAKKPKLAPSVAADIMTQKEPPEKTLPSNKKTLEKDSAKDVATVNEKVKTLTGFSKFMQCRKFSAKLSRSDLEQFCIQKICESLMLKSSEGELHQTIKKHEKTIDYLRKDLQQLTKQCKDLEIVNKKLMNELRNQNTLKKPLVPLKITRSVGLQVRLNPGNETPNQNRRRQPISGTIPQKQVVNSANSPVNRAKVTTNGPQQAAVVRQVLQNSPQKSPLTTGQTTTNNATPTNPLLSQALQQQKPRQTQVVAAKRTATPVRKTAEAAKPGNPGVIDLTDEDDRLAATKTVAGNTIKIMNKTISPAGTPNKTLTLGKMVPGKGLTNQGKQGGVQKTVTVGPNKGNALSQGIRLTPASVITSSANGSPQMVYVVPTISNAGGTQKVAFVNFQPTNGVLSGTLNGSTVSVMSNKGQTLTLKTVPSPMRQKHPASLPAPPRINLDPKLKPLLPKPHLTIKKIDTGIILQWKMPYNLEIYESIASYQLYAYQETSSPPSTDMWRKVGDVKALALPMACTLTQFADKNKYYFAVRSVDVHKRIGAFSDPEEISL